MPDELKAALGKPAERRRVHVIDRFVLVALIILMLGQYESFNQNNTIKKSQAASTIRGYINRAVTCDLIKGIGIHEPENCADKVITPYRDPSITAGSTASAVAARETRRTVCAYLETQIKHDPSLGALPHECAVP